MPDISPQAIARLTDYTLLKAAATGDDIVRLCAGARKHGFHSVCVNPVFVALASQKLQGSGVKTCSVAGFPLGANCHEVKAAEAARAVEDGATEVDMVMAVSLFKSGDFGAVKRDIRAVVQAVPGHVMVKVILETCWLTADEIRTACLLARDAGAHFVKTSTGFADGGATVEAVAIMCETVGDCMKVKASGGIRTLADAIAMLGAGADRLGIGSAAALAIVAGAPGPSAAQY